MVQIPEYNQMSLALGYDRIKDALWQQSEIADHIDTKCAVFWSIATAVKG